MDTYKPVLERRVLLGKNNLHQKFKWIVSITFLIFIVIVGILALRASMESKKTSSVEVEFYHICATNNRMKPEKRMVPTGTGNAFLQLILDELKLGPSTDGFMPSVPEGIDFLSVSLKDGIAEVNVSRNEKKLKPGQDLICRGAVVWTLTGIKGVDSVKILIDGQELKKTDGTPMGLMNRENVIIDPVISPENKIYERVSLYFGDIEGRELVKEQRKIEINQNQPKELAVLEELIVGPNRKDLVSMIPPDTKVHDVTTSEDGICYVNFSQEFMTKHNGNSTAEWMTIYSVVDTLCSLENVEKVQFLLDGEKMESFKGHIDMSQPFTKNKTLAD